jgi:hypothetical protein
MYITARNSGAQARGRSGVQATGKSGVQASGRPRDSLRDLFIMSSSHLVDELHLFIFVICIDVN